MGKNALRGDVMFCPYCGRKIEITDYIDEETDIDRVVAKEHEVWHPPLETTEKPRGIDYSGSSDWPFYRNDTYSISWTPHSWSSDYDNIRNIRR